jgi:hypothetical protein
MIFFFHPSISEETGDLFREERREEGLPAFRIRSTTEMAVADWLLPH